MNPAPVLHFGPDAPPPAVDLERLVASRMLIQANSGGGKSWALRYLLEQTHGKIPHLVLDSEGEFATLRERFPYVLAGKDGDVPADPKSAKLLCRRLVELGASAVIDLYDLKLPAGRRFVRLFLEELLHLPRSLWRPVLVVVDEAHRFCPERGSGDAESTDAVITLCTQGRKRGFAAVLATQRLSKLHKDAAAELLNVLIGRTGLDVDAKRAADILGFSGKDERAALRELAPGEFFAFGPAFGAGVMRVRTGKVQTTHPEPGKIGAAAPPAPAAVRKVLEQLQDLPEEAEAEERSVAALEERVRELQADIRRAQKAAPPPDEGVIQRRIRDALSRANGEWKVWADEMERIAEGAQAHARRTEALVEGRPARPDPAAAAVLPTHRPSRPRPDSVPDPPAVHSVGNGLSGPETKILEALGALEAVGVEQPARRVVAALSGYAYSGTFRNYLTALAGQGLIEYSSSDTVALTEVAPRSGRSLTLQNLHERWRSILPGDPPRRVFDRLVEAYPAALDRRELAEDLGYAYSGTFRNYLTVLSTRGAAEYPDASTIRATELVFPAALR